MTVEIEGEVYLCVGDVTERLEISRQTLWRWRQEGKIPSGHKFRGKQVVFSAEEVSLIEAFANRLEPITASGTDKEQLRLFNGGG
jgi:predicted DNA-binding transcriptional regulator AlpA